MLGLVIQALAFILIGAGVIVATGFGLAYLIAKSNEHDQARCECVDCQHRRDRAYQKQQAKQARKGNSTATYGGDPTSEDPKNYWTTSELRTGYHVMVKGVVYEVLGINTMPDGSTKVGLRNLLTKVPTMIIITRKMHEVKIWRKGFGYDLWR